MNVEWFFRIPYRVRVLAILLALALVVAVTYKPFIRWFNCESTDRILSLEPDDDPAGVSYDFFEVPRALSPKWTPDGTHIVFVTEEISGDTPKPISQVHVVGVDGSSLRSIFDGSKEHVIDHSPSVSPDGARVAYSAYNHVNDDSRYYEIETVALDGSDRRRLTRKAGYDIATEWLRDGERISFRRYATRECAHYFADFGIYTMKPDGSDVRRILPEDRVGRATRESIEEHAWSPDGKQVAVITERLLRGEGELFYKQTSLDVVDADGSNRRRLIDEKALLFGLAWSPDGNRIAFTRIHDNKASLLTIDRNGAGLSEVVDLPEAGTLIWSPNGTQIMLTTNTAYYYSPPHLYLVEADGSAIRRLGSGLYDAAWSPDGSRMAISVPHSFDVVMRHGSDVALLTSALDGSDARVLVRRGENGVLEAVGAERQRDGPFDIVTCSPRDPNCLQVVNGRLVFDNPCAGGFVALDPEANTGLVEDCETLWELGRWATEVRQRGYFEQPSWDGLTPISEWEGAVVEETSTGLRVVELSLKGWKLSGPISGRLATELAKLTALESVDLSGNRLSGCIPAGLRGKVTGYEEPEGCGE